MVAKYVKKCLRPYLKPVFGLFDLGYYRNMVVLHGELGGRDPACIGLYNNENILMNIILRLCQVHAA